PATQTLAPALSLSERESERTSPVDEKSVGVQNWQALPKLSLHAGQVREGQDGGAVGSNLTCADFLSAVECAQRYIRAGHIYQVNISQRLAARCTSSGWEFYRHLTAVSPSPFAAYLDCGDFQIASSSPELFLRLSGSHILTRPIKGTRP